MNEARILTRALADPATVLTLTEYQWTSLLTIAHGERLSATLAHRLDGLPIPEDAAETLRIARLNAEAGRTAALWEVEMARRALAPLDVPVVLLKGSAYLAAGLEAGQGRLVGDLDILVPRDRLGDVEAALIDAGWEWLKSDPYDNDYYRRWMHELPPLIHRSRDGMIDVHHTIVPLTARIRPDADALIADSMLLENGLRILNPEDMILHAVAHMFADGDMAGGLRNLWDVDRLSREFGDARLKDRADLHGLGKHLARAIRLSRHLYGDPGKLAWTDRLFLARILARDGWGRETHKLLRFAFYVRSHWLRMPPLMLARHLWTKWRKGQGGTGGHSIVRRVS